MKKAKISIFIFILILFAASLAACKMPSIFGDLTIEQERYTIFFSVENKFGVVPSQTVDPDTTIILPDYIIEGNRLLGWSEFGPGDRYPRPAGSEYVVRSPAILFAVLEINNSRTVVFDVSGDIFLVKSKFCTKDSEITLPDVTVASHTFKGWSETSPNDENPLPANTAYTVINDVRFYAVLEKNPPPYEYVTVEFSVDGAIRQDLTCTVEAGSSIVLPQAYMTGQALAGWCLNEKSIETPRPAGTNFVANQSAVLYAKYISMLTVFFDIEGDRGIIQPAIVRPGTTFILPNASYGDYEVAGWSETGPTDPYPLAIGSTYHVLENAVLYAVLRPKALVSFVIRYDGVDYNKNDNYLPKQYIKRGEDIQLRGAYIGVYKVIFIGWQTETEEDVIYAAYDNVVINGDTVFYAVFAPEIILTFEVFHDGENLNPNYDNPSVISAGSGQKILLPELRWKIYGYTFTGWQNESGDIFYAKGERHILYEDTVLFAVYVEQKTISFDIRQDGINYNLYNENAPVMRADEGDFITLPILNSGVPYYGLLGWSETSADDPNPMKPGTKYLVTGDTVLYAVLGRLGYLKFMIDDDPNIMDPLSVAIGEEVMLPSPSEFVRAGRFFGGWSLSPDADKNDELRVSEPYKVTDFIYLYPIWSDKVAVYYYIQGRLTSGELVFKYSYLTLKAQSINGYHVWGWSYDSCYDYDNYMSIGTQIQIKGDTSLYLVCSPAATVSFVVDSVTVSKITTYQYFDIVLPDISIQDHSLVGWSLNSNLTGTLYNVGSIYNVPYNVIFYAKYIKNQVSTEFSVNGVIVASLTQNTALNAAIALPDCDITGYKLLGWTLSANNQGTLMLPLSNYRADASRVLYAKTEKIEETYTFTAYEDGYLVSGYKGNATKLIIPSEYNGGNVVGIGKNAFSDNQTIISVTLPESVKYIFSEAFYNVIKLENINLENVEYIDDYAFYYAEKLKIASLNTINALTYIGNYAFDYASYKASDKTSVFILTPKIGYIGRYAFGYWTPDMSVDMTAVNKQHESYNLGWASSRRPSSPFQLINNNGIGFAFRFDDAKGECTIIGYHGTSGVVVIPEQVFINSRFYKVTAIAENAFANNPTVITKVVMGAAVLSIGKNAFKDNLYLSIVAFNNNIIIDNIVNAFYGTAWYVKQIL